MESGAQFSHYRLIERIGHGGMGDVFLAEDTNLRRRVALKFLREDAAASATARQRLIHEARASAALDHPFICKVYETGERDGEPFIAMEYVEGRTLARRLADGPLPLHDALRMALEIAEALQHAHTHGIIHRDLKPSNVMITAGDHVKVMDFGLAKHIATSDGETVPAPSTLGTEPGVAVGTLAYMSPEQVLGHPLDARSDIFSFGVVLYEMLAGTHPFRKNSAVSTLNAILADPAAPMPPLGVPLPDIVDRALQRMLAKDREARYADIASVRADLRWALEPARDVRRPSRTTWRRGWRALVPLAGAALLVVVMAWLIALFISPREPVLAFRARDWVVVADFENQTRDPVFDRAMDSALSVGIQQSRHVNVVPRSQVQDALRRMGRKDVKTLDESAAGEVAVREGAKAVLACSIGQVGDEYVLTARLIDPATRTAVLTESVNATGKNGVLGALDHLVTRVRQSLGESLATIAQRKTVLPKATTASLEALNAYARSLIVPGREGVKLLEQAVVLDPDFALAHADLGVHYYQGDQRAIGEEHFRKALGLLDRLTVRERLWIEALAEDCRGRREEAVTAFRAYLAEYPDDSRAWFRLGWTLMATLARLDEAIPAFKRVLEIEKSSSAADINIATCYRGQGRDAEAVPYYERAFAIDPAGLTGPFVNNEYGFTLVRLDRAEDARTVFQKMVSDPDLSKQAMGLRSLALLEMFQGRYTLACTYLSRAVVLNQTTKSPLSEFRNRMYLANAYSLLGRDSDAASQADAARRLASANRFDPSWLLSLGTFQARTGRLGDARTLLARASDTANDPVAMSGVNRSSGGDQSSINQLQGEIDLAGGRTAAALDLFDVSSRMWPTRTAITERVARTLVLLGRLDEARAQYETILAARQFGEEAQTAWFLAQLELGKIHERLGDPARAREYYEKLLTAWKDGDATLRPLVEARERLAKLTTR